MRYDLPTVSPQVGNMQPFGAPEIQNATPGLMQETGKALVGGGGFFEKIQDDIDDAVAMEVDNETSKYIRNRMSGGNGFLTLNGKNAMDASPALEQDFKAWKESCISRGQNRRQRDIDMINRTVSARINSALQQAAGHTLNQTRIYKENGLVARVDNAGKDWIGNWTDPSSSGR